MSERIPEQDPQEVASVQQRPGYDFFAEPPRRPQRRHEPQRDESRSLEQADDEADGDPQSIGSADRRSGVERPRE